MQGEHIFFFHGKDKFVFQNFYRSKIKEQLESKNLAFAFSEYHGFSLKEKENYEELRLHLTSSSLFNSQEKKVIVLWDYHLIQQGKNIESLIRGCPTDCFLFLFSKEKQKLSAIEKKFKNKIRVIEEKRNNRELIQSKIKDFFFKKVHLEKDALDFLTHHFATETDLLEKELEKIALYIHPQKNLEVVTARKALVDYKKENEIYLLMKAFFAKEKQFILTQTLNYITYHENFNQFIAFTLRELTQLLTFIEYQEQKKSQAFIFQELKIYYSFQKKNLIERGLLFTKEELFILIDEFITLEGKIKFNAFPKHYNYKNINLAALHHFMKIVLHVF